MKHQNIINQLSLKEKCYLLSGKNFWQTRGVKHSGIPNMTLSDGPHGLRKQAGAADHLGLNGSVPATCYPTAAAMANSWNIELGERMASFIGKEAAVQDVGVVLGPGLNMKRSPLCGRNFEYFSEDPYLAGKMAAAYIRGIQSNGVAACPKHFAVNSQEFRRMTSDSVVDERTLREIYLTGFEIAVKEGRPKSIMSSYNKINGTYANENYHLLQEILRDEWGFDGFVVSDWGASNDHVEGVRAGANLEMPTTGGDSDAVLEKEIKKGKISEELLNKRVDELIDVMLSTMEACEEETEKEFDVEAHHKMAEQAAEETIVLLKNEDHILPLKKKTKVVLVGDFAKEPRYQGAGSSLVNATKLETAVDILDRFPFESKGFVQGFLRDGRENKALASEAVALAVQAEVVIFYMGLNEVHDAEGVDRTDLKIPENQISLLGKIREVNQNIVVVLSCGGAVEMPWIKECKALLHGYLGGQAGASAMLNVITGKVNPSGKLAETFPKKYEHTPAYSYFPGEEGTVEYREALFIGYRYYDTIAEAVEFPFGYGLSYTEFAYSDMKCNGKEVTFKITNTGSRAGAEIAEIYVSANCNGVFRPKKELKGFTKVFLKAGETKQVTVTLDDKAFRYFNIKTNQFEVEEGEYDILVGASSQDIRLNQIVWVEGTGAVLPYEGREMDRYAAGNIKKVSDEEFEALLGHPIPDKHRSGKLDMNDAVCQMNYSRSIIGRMVYYIMNRRLKRSIMLGKPDHNLIFTYNMPFRAIYKMSGGLISEFMVKGLLNELNGFWLIGLCRFLIGFPVQLVRLVHSKFIR